MALAARKPNHIVIMEQQDTLLRVSVSDALLLKNCKRMLAAFIESSPV
jgi:hypothetical protein